jgi:histidine triad (HIT) family protein
MDFIFFEIIQGKRPGHFIYEDNTHVAFLDKYPIDHGHSLVLPKKHFEKVTDMNPDGVGALFSKIPMIAKAILKTTNADAFSMAQNNGRAAKQIVPHVHVHIIPRYNHKGTIWTKRDIGNDEELKILAEKIRLCIRDLASIK